MLLVEINYNPYLMETKIRFRGKEPRPFSRVNKFLKKPLQEWIKRLPSILYDEMNGYDFLIQFSGTRLDFDDLQKTFEDAGIGPDKVELQLKEELPARKGVKDRLIKFRDFLEEHPHPQLNNQILFDAIDKFLTKKYPVLFVKDGEYKILPSSEEFEYHRLNNIIDVSENLSDIPILIYLDLVAMEKISSSLSFLKSRKDVKNEQVFL